MKIEAKINELERLSTQGCAIPYLPAGEETKEIRQTAKEIANLLNEEAGTMRRNERIAFVGKNKRPSEEINKMAKAQGEGIDRRSGKD